MREIFTILVMCITFMQLDGQVMWQFNKDTVITWNYQWGDEFDENTINEKKWDYWFGWARSIYGNKEQQYYTDGKNHVLNNGTLTLVARKEGIDARMVDWLPDTDTIKQNNKFYSLNKTHFNYTSGMITSKPKFLYGFFEIRFKAPKEKGMWPAFWLAGGDPNEEIDMFELKGEKPDKIKIDTHCPNKCDYIKKLGKKKSWGGWLKANVNLQDGFNVVAAEWQPNQVKFYLNGICVGISKVKFAIEKSVFANLAIPSNNGPFKPGPDPSFTVSDSYEIDYIRVWGSSDLKGKNILPAFVQVKTSGITSHDARVTKKPKALYGKKEDHKNEGIIVSLLPMSGANYLVYLLGNAEKQKIKIEVRNASGNSVFSLQTSSYQTNLDFSKLPSGKYEISVKYEDKIATRLIDL